MDIQKQIADSYDVEGAYTVDEFCRRYGMGRTAFYEELNAKRLFAKKRGARTLIPRSEARRWFASLPAMEIKSAAAA